MTDTTDKARELVEMSEKAQHPFAGSLPRLRLAEAKLEHAVDLARAYLEQAEQLEAARRERDEAFKQRDLYAEAALLRNESRIAANDRADTAEALVARMAGALNGLVDEHAFICRQYERKPQQPWHAARTALTEARAAGLLPTKKETGTPCA